MPKTCRSLKAIALATFLLAAVATGSAQADGRQIGWSELAPDLEPYSNPFEELTPDQIADLRKVLLAPFPADAASDSAAREIDDARSRLEADGLDIEYLARQREAIIEHRIREATVTNEDLVSQNIKMPGYLLPLRVVNRKVTEFLLVPTVGACIHTPPPPPNQVVHVLYREGFEAEGLYTPVWVFGRLDAKRTTQTVSYVDGTTPVDVAYTLEASDIERYF